MVSTKAGISALKKSAWKLKEVLDKMGVKSEVQSFASGKKRLEHGVEHSYITLRATSKYGADIYIKVYANGHGDTILWKDIRKNVIDAAQHGKLYRVIG